MCMGTDMLRALVVTFTSTFSVDFQLRRSRVPLQHQISLAYAIVCKEAVTAI